MPSPLGHTLAACAAIISMDRSLIRGKILNIVVPGLGFVVGTLADADFIVAYYSTLPYLRHHYFSHSIPFTIALSAFVWIILKLFKTPLALKKSLIFAAAYGSHLLLDYFAHDGSKPFGIPLLWPFSHHHFIAPFNIFLSIHRGEFSDLFSLHNMLAIFIEFAVLAPILAFVVWKARQQMS
jgi:membrane-bound metal-dependent hydrolase YbcI (DUF457 family)